MRIGATLSPTSNWSGILEAARIADESGLDSVGFWDHYHSQQPDWSYITGLAAHAALAMVTERVRIVPMVVCRPNHLLGVLARETAVLSIASGGRFELGIGAGDYEEEFQAWGVPFADAATRRAALEETVQALREIWKGELVTWHGRHVQLDAAASTPVPREPPRVVVGVGASRRTLDDAVRYADELNVYADEALVQLAVERIHASGRDIGLSMYRHFDYGAWPADIAGDLRRWHALGVGRVFVNVGYGDDLAGRIRELAAIPG